MHIAPYLSFDGDCEAALTFYVRCFGGTRGDVFRYGGSPMAGHVPADWAGNCEEAFRFDEQHLGCEVAFLQRHGEAPEAGQIGIDLAPPGC
jgi:uncharacterized glyoxalase superfamily protein PhnB